MKVTDTQKVASLRARAPEPRAPQKEVPASQPLAKKKLSAGIKIKEKPSSSAQRQPLSEKRQ
ncbi:uncharacterized protein B0I36DRAFT_335263 [Microdochium trichocladiopsis]|uniref:Uncharacterized protein n=1 Tax=Microdochium trichocladiopsis TaxID=1682393 RepID=A0A9P8XUC5_9PEZI|nr:uncharacterized protein B0I36DRAFT_335263 [Microdochium trichocladiopsis]KAH7018071.1 hypothetical protein B0I36DRAFT_335263 [Microdochium trichocladiopsis]